jgi:ComF family protein
MLRPQSLAQTRVAGLFASIWGTVLDLVFPPRCASCGQVDVNWCDVCWQSLADYPIMPRQAQAFDQLSVTATGNHAGILQRAVQALKYDGVTEIAGLLADRLTGLVPHTVDVIVPVPMHPERQQTRGYNQADLLAVALGDAVGLPVGGWLERTRNTRPQVGLGRQDRLRNVQDAFHVHETINGAQVLLVDDVFTTGATLVGCARALRSAHVGGVTALTITTATPATDRFIS